MNRKRRNQRKEKKAINSNRRIIVIGGSMKFAKEIGLVNAYLTWTGEMTYSAMPIENLYGEHWDSIDPFVQNTIFRSYVMASDDMIRLYAKEYHVVAINGYIEMSVQEEINIAKEAGVKVVIYDIPELDHILHYMKKQGTPKKEKYQIPLVGEDGHLVVIKNPHQQEIYQTMDVVLHATRYNINNNASKFVSDHILDVNPAIKYMNDIVSDQVSHYKLRAFAIHDKIPNMYKYIINYYKLLGIDEYERLKKTHTVHVLFDDRAAYILTWNLSKSDEILERSSEINTKLYQYFNDFYLRKCNFEDNRFIPIMQCIFDMNNKDKIIPELRAMFEIGNYDMKEAKNIDKNNKDKIYIE